MSDRHPRVLSSTAATTLLPHADAVVVVGSRFFTSSGEPRLAEGAVVVRIDVDPDEHARAVTPAIALVADAGLACAALAASVAARTPGQRRDGRVSEEIAELRRAIRDGFAERFEELAAYCGAVRAALPDDGILVDEMTQVGYFARNGFPSYSPRTYIGSGYQGTLGFGYPTALGAKVGQPDRAVVSLSGDGGFMYNVAELATAVTARHLWCRRLRRRRLRQRQADPVAHVRPGDRFHAGEPRLRRPRPFLRSGRLPSRGARGTGRVAG